MTLAQKSFDVFITADQNIEYQNVIANYDIAVVVIKAKDNRIESYLQMAPKIVTAVNAAQKRRRVVVA